MRAGRDRRSLLAVKEGRASVGTLALGYQPCDGLEPGLELVGHDHDPAVVACERLAQVTGPGVEGSLGVVSMPYSASLMVPENAMRVPMS